MSEPKVTGWANKCNQLFIYVNHLMTRVARPEPGFFIGRSREPEPPLLVDLLGKQKKKILVLVLILNSVQFININVIFKN